MLHFWPPIAKFFHELFWADEQTMEETRQQGCWRCGGRLDRADYGRKVRGVPEAFEGLFERRFSLCCAREGCRKRSTPSSVRFFGRRIYAGALFVLASAVCALGTFRGERLLGIPRRTLGRWLDWWQVEFPSTACWTATRGLVMPPPEVAKLPASLLGSFARGDPLPLALGLLKPLTTTSSFSRVF